jgi:hypothetical protein
MNAHIHAGHLGDIIRGTISNGKCIRFCQNCKKYIPHTFQNGPFAKYQLLDGSPLVSIDENVKFPLNIRYF